MVRCSTILIGQFQGTLDAIPWCDYCAKPSSIGKSDIFSPSKRSSPLGTSFFWGSNNFTDRPAHFKGIIITQWPQNTISRETMKWVHACCWLKSSKTDMILSHFSMRQHTHRSGFEHSETHSDFPLSINSICLGVGFALPWVLQEHACTRCTFDDSTTPYVHKIK